MPVRIVPSGGGSSGGTTNTLTDVTPGIELTQRFDFSNDEAVEPGISVSQGPITAQITQAPGVELTHSASGEAQVTQQAGIQLESRFAVGNDTPTVPAVELVQVTYELTKRAGATGVTQGAVGGRMDWASTANAVGTENGTMATFAGSALGARGGFLTFSYAASTGKTDLTITLVQLLFYGRIFGTSLNNGDLRLQATLGGTYFLSETLTADNDFRVTPRTYDITANIGASWATLATLDSRVHAGAALGATWSGEIDAVVLRVLANVTDAL